MDCGVRGLIICLVNPYRVASKSARADVYVALPFRAHRVAPVGRRSLRAPVGQTVGRTDADSWKNGLAAPGLLPSG
jgi:hypothetical protein